LITVIIFFSENTRITVTGLIAMEDVEVLIPEIPLPERQLLDDSFVDKSFMITVSLNSNISESYLKELILSGINASIIYLSECFDYQYFEDIRSTCLNSDGSIIDSEESLQKFLTLIGAFLTSVSCIKSYNFATLLHKIIPASWI